MARKSGSNGQRLVNVERSITDLQREAKQSQQQLDQHIDRHILDDLQVPRYPGSNKPMYTYVEIADRYNVSPSRVQRTAVNNDVARRKNNNVG